MGDSCFLGRKGIHFNMEYSMNVQDYHLCTASPIYKGLLCSTIIYIIFDIHGYELK